MATDQALSFSVSSVIEDFIQQQGQRSTTVDFAFRKGDEASWRRFEAAAWLRRMVGVMGGKDLFPTEPSEEDFRLALRSGIILCNVLNMVQPGAVQKVVEGPSDSELAPDGAALSAFQYFENMRNFLVAVDELGIPKFEYSDLEEVGKSSRLVNCVLALKSYNDWKQGGGSGTWKFGGTMKPITAGRPFMRKNSEPLQNSVSRTLSWNETNYLNETSSSRSLNFLVREALSDKRQEEIPRVVESMLNKITEEFQRCLVSEGEAMKMTLNGKALSGSEESPSTKDLDHTKMKLTLQDKASYDSEKSFSIEDFNHIRMESEGATQHKRDECNPQMYNHYEGSRGNFVILLEQQLKNIQELKQTLHLTKEGMQFLQRKYDEDFNNLGKHLCGLAHAASGYKRVLEENRKLYNEVQDLKGNIRVYCRVRPFLGGQANRPSSVGHLYEGNIGIITPSKYGKEGRKEFTFNRVFSPSATQEEVFSDMKPLIRSVLDGYNVCIFAYGQTGSGKTYTMSGPNDLTEETLGVNYRALGDLFRISEQRKGTICYEISVQMFEIYNDQVRDLLSTDGGNKRLEVRNNTHNGINVPEANLVPVSSTPDVIHLMNLGQKNRVVSATAMNDRSSRSHSCLTVHVHGRDLTSGKSFRGCMHLVDLAGSERVDKSEVTGDRLKEATHINKSLSALGDVIASLAQKNTHVPYRNSKLTQLLQDSLGGQAKTLMFIHISPEPDSLVETISTLKFAERVSTIELGAARVNKDSGDVKELKEQIANLKAALAKEGEREHLEHARSFSPERSRMKSAGSSPLHSSSTSVEDLSSDRRQSMDDICKIKVGKKSTLKPKRRSLDPQEVSSNSWKPLGGPKLNGKVDDKELNSSDWVDKIMMNKHDQRNREENLLESWDLDNKELPDIFSKSYLPDPSKIYPEVHVNKLLRNKKEIQDNDVQRTQYDMAATDDSDDLEAATSDCSETDLLWQSNLPRTSSIPDGFGARAKKTQARPRSAETRSMIPSLIPSPVSRKSTNVSSLQSYRPVKQTLSNVGGRRRNGNAK